MITDVNLTEAFEELDNINDDEVMDKQRSWDEFSALVRDVEDRLGAVQEELLSKWVDQKLYRDFMEIVPNADIKLSVSNPEPYIHPKFGAVANPALLRSFHIEVAGDGSTHGSGFDYIVKTPKDEMSYVPGERWVLSDRMDTILNKGDLSWLKDEAEKEMKFKLEAAKRHQAE